MKNDNRIEELVQTIHDNAKDFVEYVSDLNQCAYTDSMIENIISAAKELERLYYDNSN